MNRQKLKRFAAYAVAAGLVSLQIGIAKAQLENTGQSQQELVSPHPPLDQQTQEQFGLLTLTNPEGSCSASMLNDYWAITAAHCVFSSKGMCPQFPANQISLQAKWPGWANLRATRGQPATVQALQVISYGTPISCGPPQNLVATPSDIAIIQVGLHDLGRPGARPVKLHPQRPMANENITAFGRGINALAYVAKNGTAVPTKSDGQYRYADFAIASINPNSAQPPREYSFPGNKSATTVFGDSGGPSYIQDWDDPLSVNRKLEWRLIGVHSWGAFDCLQGKSCSDASLAGQWVASISRGWDAAILPVRDRILAAVEAIPPSDDFVGTFPPPGPGVTPVFIYAVNPDGRLMWLRHDGAEKGDGLSTPGAWLGPRPVGRGWDDMEAVFGGGGNSIYAIDSAGLLKWNHHNGFNTGAGLEDRSAWAAGNDVGRGWGGMQHVFPGGNGVIYTISNDGVLHWLKHNGFRTGEGLSSPGAWEGPKDVGRGWGGLQHVFSGGDGIIYTISDDGILRWLKHNKYLTGEGLSSPGAWEGPKDVGRGWGNLKHVFAGGRGGIIYTVSSDGTLRWLKHNGFWTGEGLGTPGSWTGPKDVGRGWGDAVHVFALLPSDPAPPH